MICATQWYPFLSFPNFTYVPNAANATICAENAKIVMCIYLRFYTNQTNIFKKRRRQSIAIVPLCADNLTDLILIEVLRRKMDITFADKLCGTSPISNAIFTNADI